MATGERDFPAKAAAFAAIPTSAWATTIVGAGALIALWFSLFHYSSPLATTLGDDGFGQLSLGLCVGILLCGLAATLFCAKDNYRTEHLGVANPALLHTGIALGGVMLAIGLVGAFVLSDSTASVVVLGACGTALGFGLGLIAFLLFEISARCSAREFSRCAAWALVCSVVLRLPLVFLDGQSVPVFGIIMVIIGCTCTLLAARLRPSTGHVAATPEDQEATVSERVSSYFRSSWGPLIALAISLWLLGYRSDSGGSVSTVAGIPILFIKEYSSALTAAAVFFALYLTCDESDILARLQRIVIPIVVATFIITPYFSAEETGLILYEVLAVARGGSTLIFVAGLGLTLVLASRAANASLFFAAGFAAALCSLCTLSGFFLGNLVGSTVSDIVALMFVAYLIVALVLQSVGHEDEKRAQALEKRLFDEYLAQRCSELAREYGLTPRESEMLVHLGRGHGYVYIAELTFVSECTVRAHAKSIFKKCGVSSREELIDLIDEDSAAASQRGERA